MPDVVIGHTFRFTTSSAAANVAVSQADIMDLVLMAATATSGYRLFASAKVRRVDVWSPGTAGAIGTASVEFLADTSVAGSRHQLVSDSTMGTARPAHVSAVPAVGSLAAMWMSDAVTSSLLQITCAAGSIVDVAVTFTLRNNESASAVASLSGLTAGQVYCHPLDGHSGQFVPVAWTTAN